MRVPVFGGEDSSPALRSMPSWAISIDSLELRVMAISSALRLRTLDLNRADRTRRKKQLLQNGVSGSWGMVAQIDPRLAFRLPIFRINGTHDAVP
jgi:hypothetical protein